MAIGIVLLWGPKGVLFLMSEVPLHTHEQTRRGWTSGCRQQASACGYCNERLTKYEQAWGIKYPNLNPTRATH